ncbi:hypothetical protein Sango_1661500 [Sesamum angolense]|uniref:Uncharacterized protein n=1 Tax=Sesamum angolense TaxID=2727404 RepID=A0AAE2BRE5_9LAMI|nr:hypothetical protein Sango_1661500 [Sesamum angolense]
MSSNNWLGFSLTPHLRVGGDAEVGGDATEEEAAVAADNSGGGGGCCFPASAAAHVPVMPLRSDGTFSVLDSKHYWRYDNDMNGPNLNEEGPKFEDFLGCCYSNSPSNEPGEINMNMPPNFSSCSDDHHKRENFTVPSPFLPPYHYTIVPTAAAANPDVVYSAAFGGGGGSTATSVSVFKSWFHHTEKPAVEGSSQCDFQALSLTVNPSSQPDVPVALRCRRRVMGRSGRWQSLARLRSLYLVNQLILSAKELLSTAVLRGIDGLEDMKLICGITVAERKDKPGKEDKVKSRHTIF